MGIQKRTVFVEKVNGGVYRPAEVAMVQTTIGAMVEVFPTPFERDLTYAAYDPTDEAVRVDEIKLVDLDSLPSVLPGAEQGPWMTVQSPGRVGR